MKDVTVLEFNGMQYPVRTEELQKVPESNIIVIREYDGICKDFNLTETTRSNTIQFLIILSKAIPKKFNEITSQDLLQYVRTANIQPSTKSIYIIRMKKFFKWLYKDENPECIKGLINGKVKQNRKKWSDLVTEEEVQKIIDTYPDIQHKALISVLYDSACRVGEIVKLKRKDVVCKDGLWTISVDGKTGVRNVPLTLSVVYFAPWFNELHPAKKDGEAPVFISFSHKDWYKPMVERSIGREAVWTILQQGVDASQIGKKVHPHLLRHSRLTWLADHGMTENMMRIFAGWTPGSNMPAIYIHTNPQKVNDKIIEIQNGKPVKPIEEQKSKLLPRECPRCQAKNDPSAPYCKQCWLPLEMKVSMMETIMIDLMRSEIYKEESEIARQEGRFLDMEQLAHKLQEWKAESNRPDRKQVPPPLPQPL